MLIFKDSILGLVAGVQLSINKMVLPGDWIEMASADADGTVTEISLITVKVQNWDNTITTIPAYDLVTKPVKNWRGMSTSGVRRIKRSVYLDMTSVQFCTKEMLDKYRKIQYLDEYITSKDAEIKQHNQSIAADTDIEMNGRHLTNLGIFRAYLQRYLEHHPMLSHDFTLMARQMQPTNLGMPIEIYAFVKTTNWMDYEKTQSDIFDYIISSVNYFDLRLFQNPSWNDYRKR
jgi:miniconductance mechanosensitive channel